MRRRTLLGLGLAVVCGGALPSVASGATITVNTTADGFEGGGVCTLREAVSSANDNSTALGCSGDTAGLDTILLQGGQTYLLTRHAVPDNTNANGDLDITGGGGTIIRSTGPGLATVDADSNVFPGPPVNQRDRGIEILPGAGGVTLERIRLQNGSVTDGDGGGIKSRAALTLIDSEVRDNSIGVFGGVNLNGGAGILILDPGSLTLTRSTVSGNLAKANPASTTDAARGAGITFASGGALNATNSTISGNVVDSSGNTVSATYAGGLLYSFGSAMNLTNVTISNNSAIGGTAASVFGGGMVLFDENATLRATILAGNQAPAQLDCAQFGSDDDWISAGDNVIGDSSGCGHVGGSNDLFFANPNLGPLSNYGGLTRTMLPNPGSPAINRGGTCPATDQRGLFRAGVAPCDTGAVEVGATVSPPASPPAGPTGQRAAALKKCKKIKKKKRLKKCKRKANLLPV